MTIPETTQPSTIPSQRWPRSTQRVSAAPFISELQLGDQIEAARLAQHELLVAV